jgi:pSer/pThr/pTyr-binding forkhead associated (FHA) protein
MSEKVTVTIEGEAAPRKEMVFSTRTMCMVGRANDCHIRFPSDLQHLDVSRHHCLLGIDPPRVWVRDLGSKNGTFVNGTNIGQLSVYQLPEPASVFPVRECPVRGGDEIQVGHTLLHVAISGAADG